MAVSKYPIIRYQTLNRCFRNTRKDYDIYALMDACADAIYEYCGEEIGCSRRTILSDIDFMESDAGWSIDLERIKDGHKTYFRYRDPNFSINQSLLSETECDKLNEVMLVLEKFKGIPCFEWVDDIMLKLNNGFKESSDAIIEFEKAPSLKGMELFDPLFDYIKNRQTLDITYQSFGGTSQVWAIHPYLLKQHNRRWFLFGKNSTKGGMIYNLPLDRIEHIEKSKVAYEEDDGSLRSMLDKVFGVTINSNAQVENIILKFSEHRFPYVTTKKIHESQVVTDPVNRIIQITVVPNKELVAHILQYGDDVEVLEPLDLRNEISGIIGKMSNLYKDAVH